nr:molybdate ABC transporter substrate-binding protein [uncultured Agathobaculum sp.]
MKRKLCITTALLLMLSACGSTGTSSTNQAEEAGTQSVELNVFAAASMQETLEQIVEDYQKVAPDVTIQLNLDSSGTLKTQIEEGASCDIFISAAQKQMNELDITAGEEANPDQLDYVDPDTRIDLLENKVVLVVPEGNPKDIHTLAEIAEKADLVALGNADVPVGQYSEELLKNLGVWDTLNQSGKITFGSNVKEVTTQVSEGIADCGIVYATDAFSAGLEPVDQATEEMCGQVIYPAAVLKTSAHPDEAQAFLDYLQTEDAASVFESVGFQPLT